MARRGEPRSKLTWKAVDEIRALAGSVGQRELAARYGVVRETVSLIVRKKAWVWTERLGYYDAERRHWVGPPSPCLGCGRIVRAYRCSSCQKLFVQETAEARRAAHLCKQCGGPNEDWRERVNCLECRAAKRTYDARRYAEGRPKHRLLKLEAFAAYGGAVCICCGDEHWEFLTLDHVNGGGNAHRRSLLKVTSSGRPSSHFYGALKRLGWPSDPPLQVMCLNCNWAKGHFGYCPHQKEAVDAPALLD